MKIYILPGLIANAAGLGIHWIYDYKYLGLLAKRKSLLFLKTNKAVFDKANPAFYCYPDSTVGDLSVQGQIMLWLYQAMKENKNFSQTDYSNLLLDRFKPGGSYIGYVETYSKKHVLSYLAKELNIADSNIEANDDHLVGFIPYLVCKELGLSSEKAFELTSLFASDEDYLVYFKMFDELFNLLPKIGMNKAIKSVIAFGTKKYKVALEKAVEISNTNRFIESYSGRACAIKYAVPLIIHILAHTASYREAIELNALIGGAVSDRGTLLGAIYAQVTEVPEEWTNKVKKRIVAQSLK